VQVLTGAEVIAEEEAHADAHVHLPAPSYWPIVLAAALPIIAYGVLYSTFLIVVGGAIAVLGMFGLALEPADAHESDFDPPDDEPSKELVASG
jgi:cytochrome c oxidase subunit 1